MRRHTKPAPRSLYVQMDITTRCNLRCIMCAREQNTPEGNDMTVESFEMIARQVLDKASVLNLSCGAEPLVSKHFDEILDVVKAYHVPRVEFVTNGILLNERRAHRLVECGVTSVEVSMDGARKETYERIRRGASYDRLVANLERLKAVKAEHGSRRPHVRLNFVMMRSNIEELPAFVEMAKELDACEVVPQHLVVFEKAGLEKESLHQFQVLSDAMIRQARQVAQRYGILFRPVSLFQEREKFSSVRSSLLYRVGMLRTYGLAWVVELGRKSLRRRFAARNAVCPLPWEYVLVSPGGLILPCGVWFGETPMGDIREKSFEEIWWGEHYQRLREELSGLHPLRQVCAHCPAVISRRVDEDAFQSVTV